MATARAAAARMDLANLEFRVLDAATLAGDPLYREAFDYVTAFDAIHDQSRPREVLASIRWMLAPGGLFSMVDIAAHSRVADNLDHPMGPFLYAVSLMHCTPVGLVDGGEGLGMMWGREKAEAMLTAAGFEQVDVEPVPEDAFNLYFLCRI